MAKNVVMLQKLYLDQKETQFLILTFSCCKTALCLSVCACLFALDTYICVHVCVLFLPHVHKRHLKDRNRANMEISVSCHCSVRIERTGNVVIIPHCA